jgi:hypothetical protein
MPNTRHFSYLVTINDGGLWIHRIVRRWRIVGVRIVGIECACIVIMAPGNAMQDAH